MNRNLEKRLDVREIFPEAKGVISLGLHYNTPNKHQESEDAGKISRYAWGKDYHLIIWDKLKLLIANLQQQFPDFEAVSYVDTGPVMDKAWAARAGLGWLGKHSNIINPQQGSWFFIATVICNVPFPAATPVADHCGSCTRCVDACPTHAIEPAYTVNAGKCISYQTIENKEDIAPDVQANLAGWLFGCDICQEVCPWNHKFSVFSSIPEFAPVDGKTSLSVTEVLQMENAEFKQRFAESPILRAKLKGLQRNAMALTKNGR